MYRKVDELGRVTIPSEIRENLNICNKDLIKFTVLDSKILLEKEFDSCIFCNAKIGLKDYKNQKVCPNCFQDIKRLP